MLTFVIFFQNNILTCLLNYKSQFKLHSLLKHNVRQILTSSKQTCYQIKFFAILNTNIDHYMFLDSFSQTKTNTFATMITSYLTFNQLNIFNFFVLELLFTFPKSWINTHILAKSWSPHAFLQHLRIKQLIFVIAIHTTPNKNNILHLQNTLGKHNTNTKNTSFCHNSILSPLPSITT